MADQSDVENALCDFLRGALATCPVRVFRGWPLAGSLDAAMAAGFVLATVLPVDGSYRLTTRHTQQDVPAPAAVTLTAVADGASVLFGGVAARGQVAGVIVDGVAYAYRAQDGDTAAAVAANIAQAIGADRAATAHGASVTVPAAGRLVGRAVADTAFARELRRQEQDFRVTLWCPAPDARDDVAAAADVALAQLDYLPMPDGSAARVRGGGGSQSDEAEAAGVYRRDVIVRCEYATTATQVLPAMLFGRAQAGGRAVTG